MTSEPDTTIRSVTDRPDVDTLETGLMKFLDALDEEGNTTKPIRAAVRDLAARTRRVTQADDNAAVLAERALAAEADRDRLRKKLDAEKHLSGQRRVEGRRILHERNEFARRVTELEAEVRALEVALDDIRHGDDL